MGTKCVRSSKTTRSQFELFINELRINKPFRENKFEASDPDVIKRSWENLCEKLNASGGPVRVWKRVFTDWKSQTRAKARKISTVKYETGNIGPPPKPLTDLEEQLLDVTGRVVVEGMANVPEIGLDEQFQNKIDLQPGPSKAIERSIATKPTTTSAKRKRSLYGSLEKIVNQSTAASENKEVALVLKEIKNEVKTIRQIQNKKLKLKFLELKMKHPECEFILTSSSDSE